MSKAVTGSTQRLRRFSSIRAFASSGGFSIGEADDESAADPGPGFFKLIRQEQLDRRATHPSSSEGQCVRFPAWLGHDRDPRDLATVREKEVEVVPIHAALPTLEVVQDNKKPRLGAGIDLLRH